MRLVIKFPPEWVHEHLGGVDVVTAQGYKLVPDILFEVFPLVPRRELASEAILGRSVPPGAEIARAAPVLGNSNTGWPMTLTEVDIRGAAIDEIRLLARYDILVLAGAVLVRATNRVRYAARKNDVLKLLRTARPSFFTDEPARIGDLWDMGGAR
jgi:hypothetical protein